MQRDGGVRLADEALHMQAAVQQRLAVERGARLALAAGLYQCAGLTLQGQTVSRGVGGIGCLYRELADALEVPARRGQAGVSHLQQRHHVVHAAQVHGRMAAVCDQSVGDGQAGGVITCTVDPHARAQPRHAARDRVGGHGEDAIRCKGSGVAEDRWHVAQTLTYPTYRPVLQRT